MQSAIQAETDTEQAVRFLEWLRPGGPWVLTAIPPEGGRTNTQTLSDAESVRAWVERFSGKQNCYFMVNPARGTLSSKAKKEDVEELAMLHVDVDPRRGEDLKKEQERVLKVLEDFSPSPSAIIFSGGGYQSFWRLAEGETLYVGGDANRIADGEAYNRQLELVLGGDRCGNIDRIMRLPGTINLPDEKKREKGRVEALATIVELNELEYSLADFTAVDPEPGKSGRGRSSSPASSPIGTLRRLAALDELDEWAVPDRCKALIAQGEDPVEPGKFGGDRSPVVFALCCELVRRCVPVELIAGIISDPAWPISAHVLAQTRPEDYARRQVERASAEVADSWPMHDVDAAVGWVNARYFAALEGKRITYFREDGARLTPMDKEAFTFELADREVMLGSGKKQQLVPVAKLWIRDPARRYYPRGFVLDPDAASEGDAYNLWRGFGIHPAPGDWSRMRDHIETVLANGNAQYANYITRWAAWSFQNPATPPKVALVFRGGEGVGKGIFAASLLRAFGDHGLHVRSMGQVTGKFNAHLRHCCMLYADEADAASTREEGALKGLISESRIPIEGKGKDLIEVDNHIHLVMASNEGWVVPAGKDSRRYAVFDVSSARQRDRRYFEGLATQMAEGGLAAMVHDMLQLDLADFHPEHDRPDTEALSEQRAASLRGFEKILFDALASGEMPALGSTRGCGAGHVFVATKELREYAQKYTRREDISLNEVADLLARLGSEKRDSARPRGWVMPPLDQMRARWDDLMFGVPWKDCPGWGFESELPGDPY